MYFCRKILAHRLCIFVQSYCVTDCVVLLKICSTVIACLSRRKLLIAIASRYVRLLDGPRWTRLNRKSAESAAARRWASGRRMLPKLPRVEGLGPRSESFRGIAALPQLAALGGWRRGTWRDGGAGTELRGCTTGRGAPRSLRHSRSCTDRRERGETRARASSWTSLHRPSWRGGGGQRETVPLNRAGTKTRVTIIKRI